MIKLPNVTMVIVDTMSYGKAIEAIRKSLEHIEPAKTLFFTDVELEGSFEVVKIPTIKSKDEYSTFIIKQLSAYVETDYILIIQADGYVLDGSMWTDEFLEYDYIGAPWLYTDGYNVGNGGFSLRSKKLMDVVRNDNSIKHIFPEDQAICRLYGDYLQKDFGMKFAPEHIAKRFAYELQQPMEPTFGFHGAFHTPYRQMIVIKRTAAMGDIIMMEPVMAHFNKLGYQVVLDIPPVFFPIFERHFYLVLHVMQIPDLSHARVINLDMAYEARPKQLALKSYYEMSGVTDGALINPRIFAQVDQNSKLFKRYVVFHIDDTAMAHRNIHGVNWKEVEKFFTDLGYAVIQVGRGAHRIGLQMNSATHSMLTYAIVGADLFVGIDSGPSQIAVATKVKCVIFFGSVNPKYRYADMSNITVIQNPCPIAKDGCYHSVVSEVGTDCEVDKVTPPCISHTAENVINIIKNIL